MRIDVEVPTTLSDLDFYAQIGAFVSFELIHIVIILLGGIALFLFGMQLMGDGLKKVAGGKLEVILYRLSNTPLKGVLLGTGVTAIIQSSSATSVMVVGFALAVGEFRGEPCEVEVDVGSCGVERGFLSPFGEVASELV